MKNIPEIYDSFIQEFWRLVDIGSKLRKIHLMEDIGMEKLTVGYNVGGGNVVESVRWEMGSMVGDESALGDGDLGIAATGVVFINETQCFENVSEVAWNFYIGGYQPAQKWLKDRKGRELSFDDILHYQKIIYCLEQTKMLMQTI